MRAHPEQTLKARPTPVRLAYRALRRSLPLVAALSLAPVLAPVAPIGALKAQTVVRAGSRSVSMNATARLVIGVRLHARQVGAVVRGARSEGFTEVSIPVEAAANLAWRLAVAAPRVAAGDPTNPTTVPNEDAASDNILVLNEHGAWVPLPVAGSADVSVASGEPTNPTPRMLRFRVANAADISRVERLRLVMQPAVGAP
jgi:hypothetical protein